VRKPRTATSPPFTSLEEERVYKMAHQGQAYDRDNQKVFEILTQLLSGTMAWTWISSYELKKNGKGAFEALKKHYEGPGQLEIRTGHACHIIKTTHYKPERQFTFESYVTKLSEAFEILNDHEMPKQKREKVEILLDGIQSDNQIVITAKTTVKMNLTMRASFQVAVDHLLELISSTFHIASNQGARPARNVSRMETGRGVRGGGRGDRGGKASFRMVLTLVI
jgi:predicted transcriptional regulator